MSKKRKSSLSEQASYRLVFVCFLIIIFCVVCFSCAYLKMRVSVSSNDEIWTDSSTSYDEKVERQRAADKEIQDSRKDAIKE